MVLDAHPGEGQPVQRRVSYRRLREEENAKATSNGGDSAPLLPTKGVFDGDNLGDESNLGADTITTSPSSIWQEAWLAVRCGTCGGRPTNRHPVQNDTTYALRWGYPLESRFKISESHLWGGSSVCC